MRSFLLVAIAAPLVSSFVFETMTPRKGLQQIIESQTDQRVSVSLDIGNAESTSRLAVNGMVLDLSTSAPGADYEHVKMPGANGPHPNLSAGIRRLDFVQDGSFISQMGTKYVKAEKGCWEMVRLRMASESPKNLVLVRCGMTLTYFPFFAILSIVLERGSPCRKSSLWIRNP